MIIDIVIPVLNEAGNIAALLESLQSLRTCGHTLTVVDGGSTDGTVNACERYVDEIRITGAGRALQMNAGAEARKGDVLLFLHADTRLPADAESCLYGFLTSGRAWGRFDIQLSSPDSRFRVIERMVNWRSRLTGIATGDQAMFVRREVFESLGGFTDIPLMEDVELSSRLRAVSRPFCIGSPVVTSSRKWEREGTLRTVLLMWRLRMDYWRGVSPTDLVKRYYIHESKHEPE